VLVIEDAALPGAGLATRLVHRLDAGDFIRTPEAWRALAASVLRIEETDTFVSGVCSYALMLCARP
jgi:hypothetical protein